MELGGVLLEKIPATLQVERCLDVFCNEWGHRPELTLVETKHAKALTREKARCVRHMYERMTCASARWEIGDEMGCLPWFWIGLEQLYRTKGIHQEVEAKYLERVRRSEKMPAIFPQPREGRRHNAPSLRPEPLPRLPGEPRREF